MAMWSQVLPLTASVIQECVKLKVYLSGKRACPDGHVVSGVATDC